MRKWAKCWETKKKSAKCWESRRKFAESWGWMLKVEKVRESVLKNELV